MLSLVPSSFLSSIPSSLAAVDDVGSDEVGSSFDVSLSLSGIAFEVATVLENNSDSSFNSFLSLSLTFS